jgi:hypothetical protein
MNSLTALQKWDWKTERDVVNKRVLVLLGTDVALLLSLLKTDPKALTRLDWAAAGLTCCALPFLIETFYLIERLPADKAVSPRPFVFHIFTFGVALCLSVSAYSLSIFNLSPILGCIFVGVFLFCASMRKLLKIH